MCSAVRLWQFPYQTVMPLVRMLSMVPLWKVLRMGLGRQNLP